MRLRIVSIAVAAGLFLAPSAAVAATSAPQFVRPHQHILSIPADPGGNGKQYRHIAHGVYGYTVAFKKGYTIYTGGRWHTYKGVIYAGSGRLKDRRNYWRNYWSKRISKGDTWTWHVLSRDWSISASGDTPHGLSAALVRLGAEQVAISKFLKWGRRHNYYVRNTDLNILKGYRKARREQMIQAGAKLFQNQLENNAKAGNARGDGDILNEGAELPGGAMAELPGYGTGGHKRR